MRRSRWTLVDTMHTIQTAWTVLLVGFLSWQVTRGVATRLGRPLAWWEWVASLVLGMVLGLGFLVTVAAATLGPIWLIANLVDGLRRRGRRQR